MRKYELYDFETDKDLREKLFSTSRIIPTHSVPTVPKDYHDWDEYKKSKWIYDGFLNCYVDWINSSEYYSPWIFEINKSHEVHLSGYIDGPTFGGAFDIYYNAVNIGSYEVSPMISFNQNGNETVRHLRFYAHINYARCIPYGDIAKLFEFMSRYQRDEIDRVTELLSFQQHLLGCLWDNRPIETEILLECKGQFDNDWLYEQGYLRKNK